MTPLNLPARLKSLYEQSPHRPAADLAQQSFMHWLDNFTKPLTFFPEYTDHGRPHLESVLTSAEALIPDHVFAKQLLTPDDALLLILAVLLHDAAMALTEDQFLALVVPTPSSAYPLTAPTLNPNHPEKTFSVLFDEFLAEARRWDGRKLINVLGAPDPNEPDDDPISYIQHPNKLGSPEKWTKRHRRFLGEFLRLHHPRLAHHFALHGLPHIAPGSPGVTARSNNPPSLPSELPPYLKDLAGLIARSHGIPLRDTFPYFQKFGKNKRAVTHNTHPIYLMAILRIADFLQIDRTRGTDLSAVRKICSPLSELHWRAQAAVEDATWDLEDSEAINFTAVPSNSETFLHLQDLLRGPHGLQQELDTTWAILGQVFSFLKNLGGIDLSKFGLTLRRVTSNIDDTSEFIKHHNPPYYPCDAKFDTAGPDLIKLLVEPLYGGLRPEIGIRELLQNSLDAVRELDQFCNNHGCKKSELPQMHGTYDILIALTEEKAGGYCFTISDRGIGMTSSIIRDYFLRAGASFRTSDAWKREFLKEQNSTVLRSGRFGIGSLAAMLLGNRIEVTTRHVSSAPENGVFFSASIFDTAIQLARVKVDSIGTTIKIDVSKETVSKLIGSTCDFRSPAAARTRRWEWYYQLYPQLGRMLNTTEILPPKLLPSLNPEEVDVEWRNTSTQRYPSIKWKYQSHVRLACNGIRIHGSRSDAPPFSWPKQYSIPFPVPDLSIADPNGDLPLDLRRDRLIDTPIDIADAVLGSITEDLVACMLVHAPTTPRLSNEIAEPFMPFVFTSWNRLFIQLTEGVCFQSLWHFDRANLNRLLCFPLSMADRIKTPITHGIAYYSDLETRSQSIEDQDFFPQKLATKHKTELLLSLYPQMLEGTLNVSAFRVATPYDLSKGGRPKELRGCAKKRTQSNLYWFDSTEPFPSENRELEKLLEYVGTPTGTISELSISGTPALRESPYTKTFEKYMSDPVIPYDRAKRRKKFGHAFKVLADLIAKWEAWKPKDHQ